MTDQIRALIVDDDAGVRFTLSETLRRAGYQVATVADGGAALELLRERSFDLAILDLNLGTRTDGLRVLEGIRWRWPQMAVVILTAYGSLESAMAAIRARADDYLLKPVEPAELLAAAREALARRRTRAAAEPAPQTPPRLLRHGPLVLDLDKYQLERAGSPVELAPAEFKLLAHLIENAHRAVPPKELVRVVRGYEPDYQHEARQIAKWYIHRLRARIEADPSRPAFILNVRGVGYIMGPAGAEDGATPTAGR